MRILIIENDPKHLADAREAFGQMAGVEADYATCFVGLLQGVRDRMPFFNRKRLEDYDGVISDVFFPGSEMAPYDNDEPCGVGVMMLCYAKKKPCVLITAGWHHGVRYDWICQLQRELSLPDMVDGSDDHDKEAGTKDWVRAYRRLQAVMQGKHEED
jgi:hypothetical protein